MFHDGAPVHKLPLSKLIELRENKILLVRLPPDCTHLLQPCDLTVFKVWKQREKELITEFGYQFDRAVHQRHYVMMMESAAHGKVVDQYGVVVREEPEKKIYKVQTAVQGFLEAGLWGADRASLARRLEKNGRLSVGGAATPAKRLGPTPTLDDITPKHKALIDRRAAILGVSPFKKRYAAKATTLSISPADRPNARSPTRACRNEVPDTELRPLARQLFNGIHLTSLGSARATTRRQEPSFVRSIVLNSESTLAVLRAEADARALKKVAVAESKAFNDAQEGLVKDTLLRLGYVRQKRLKSGTKVSLTVAAMKAFIKANRLDVTGVSRDQVLTGLRTVLQRNPNRVWLTEWQAQQLHPPPDRPTAWASSVDTLGPRHVMLYSGAGAPLNTFPHRSWATGSRQAAQCGATQAANHPMHAPPPPRPPRASDCPNIDMVT